MKTVRTILIIIGILGIIVFGVQALNDSESFSLFGLDIAVSKANWAPLIVSALVLLVGVVLPASKKVSQ